jgi:hypothetical protein
MFGVLRQHRRNILFEFYEFDWNRKISFGGIEKSFGIDPRNVHSMKPINDQLA